LPVAGIHKQSSHRFGTHHLEFGQRFEDGWLSAFAFYREGGMHSHNDWLARAARRRDRPGSRWLNADVHPCRRRRPWLNAEQFGKRLQMSFRRCVQALGDDLAVAGRDLNQRIPGGIGSTSGKSDMLQHTRKYGCDLLRGTRMLDEPG
jgi:hypothetical protein